MRIIADISSGTLVVAGTAFPISCVVRTLRDGTRGSDEVVRTVPEGRPYDPRPFPKGLWRVSGVEWRQEKRFDPKVYGPVRIRTNAWQPVNVWELDEYGDYLRETPEIVRDWGYLLHYSESKTTWGCVRLNSPADAVALAERVADALSSGEIVELEAV
jgi:hypothetical protein